MTGTFQVTENKDGYTLTRDYKVVSDDGSDNEINVLFDSRLPQYGALHPAYPLASVKSRVANQESADSKRVWVVSVTWDTKAEEGEDNDPSENSNPLNERGTFRVVSTNRDEIMVKDAEDNPIESSAGEPIRGVTKEVSDFSFVISKNLAASSVDFPTIAEMINQVNDDDFFGAPSGKAKLVRFEADYLYHKTPGNYFATQWEFSYRDSGWDLELLDEGYFELDSNGDQKQIMVATIDADGNEGEPVPVTEPHLLDGNGKRLDSGDPIYLDFKRVTEKDFSELNIPTSLAGL